MPRFLFVRSAKGTRRKVKSKPYLVRVRRVVSCVAFSLLSLSLFFLLSLSLSLSFCTRSRWLGREIAKPIMRRTIRAGADSADAAGLAALSSFPVSTVWWSFRPHRPNHSARPRSSLLARSII